MPSSVLREQYLALAADGSVGHNEESAATMAERTKLVPIVDGPGIAGESMVGATICFTPEPSPPNSPTTSKRDKSYNNGDKVGNSSEGSNCYIGSIAALSSKGESAGKDMVSSVHQIASSLDGKSTTEYQILDGISSKGTLEIEDLLDEDSSDRSQNKKRKEGVLEAAALDSEATLSNINDNDSSPSDVSKLTIQTSFIDTEDAPTPPTVLDDRPAPDVDETPLIPFANLHKLWESRSPTISAIGRMFGAKKPNTNECPPVPKDEAIAKATLPGEESSRVNESVQARSAPGSKSSNAALKELFMFIVSLIASNLAALCLLLRGSATLLLGPNAKPYLRLILDKISGAQGSIGSDPSSNEDGCDSEGIVTKQVPVEPALFHEEFSPQATSSPLENATAALAGTSNDDLLNAKEKDALGRINQRFAASVTRYGDFALVGVIAVIAMVGLSYFTFIDGSPAFQADRSYREDFVCILSRDMSLVAVPYWEFKLLSSADSLADIGRFGFESMEADSNWRLAAFTSLTIAIAVGAALIFNWQAIESISRRKHQPSSKRQTGIWTTLEHKQFIEGYHKYGTNWKAVARLVPSRSHKQGE